VKCSATLSLVAIGVLLLVAESCVGRTAPSPGGPLPPAPAKPLQQAATSAEHPFVREAANVLARTVFEAAGPSNTRIAVRVLLVRPGQTVLPVTRPVLIDVLMGQGALSIGGDRQLVRPANALIALPEGAREVLIDNPNTSPLVLRLYVFEAK
jgi:hypothetical protein